PVWPVHTGYPHRNVPKITDLVTRLSRSFGHDDYHLFLPVDGKTASQCHFDRYQPLQRFTYRNWAVCGNDLSESGNISTGTRHADCRTADRTVISWKRLTAKYTRTKAIGSLGNDTQNAAAPPGNSSGSETYPGNPACPAYI